MGRSALLALGLLAMVPCAAGMGYTHARLRHDGVLVDAAGRVIPVPESDGNPHRAEMEMHRRAATGRAGHESHGYYPDPDMPQRRGAKAQSLQSIERCVWEKGEQLCLQRDVAPTCPEQFRAAAWTSCYHLADFLNRESQDREQAVDTDVKLWWWTNQNCSMHRLLCHVDHPTHKKQYEFQLIDFEDSCHENIGYTYQFDYNIEYQGKVYANTMHGSILLRHGKSARVMSIRDGGTVIREEYLAILLFEMDNNGKILFKSPGMQLHRSLGRFGANPLGLYGQFHFLIVVLNTDGTRSHHAPAPLNYHVTPYLFLSHCTGNNSWVNGNGATPGPAGAAEGESSGGSWYTSANGFAIFLGVVPFIVCVSIAVHVYLARRRAFYASQEQARTEMIHVQANPEPVVGVVVQGIAVSPHAASPATAGVAVPIPALVAQPVVAAQPAEDDVCEAAPLPPSFATAAAAAAPPSAIPVAAADQSPSPAAATERGVNSS